MQLVNTVTLCSAVRHFVCRVAKMHRRLAVDALLFQTAMINALFLIVPLKMLSRTFRPSISISPLSEARHSQRPRAELTA